MTAAARLAALDSLRRIDAFNETHAPRLLPTRFGLHAGLMVLGNVVASMRLLSAPGSPEAGPRRN